MTAPNPVPAWISTIADVSADRNCHDVPLAGQPWIYWAGEASLSHHQNSPDTPNRTMRILEIRQTTDGDFHWESAAILIPSEWYARASGTAPTPEAAAQAALDYRHAVRSVGFVDWISGTTPDGRPTWETRIGDEVVMIDQARASTTWHWRRCCDLTAFRDLGIDVGHSMEGGGETSDDAMAAALDAPTLLRAACRRYLAATMPLGSAPAPVAPWPLQVAA